MSTSDTEPRESGETTLVLEKEAVKTPEPAVVANKVKDDPPRELAWNHRVYAKPGAARHFERKWQGLIHEQPVVSMAEYAKTHPVKDIEEIVPCLLCGSEYFKHLFHPAKKDWEYDVVMCAECDFLFRNPNIIPEHLHKLYDGVNYNNFLSGSYGKNRQMKYQSVLASFRDLVPPKSDPYDPLTVFDFGCGNGLALEVMQDRGYETWGIDLSPESVEVAKQRLGHDRVWCGEPPDMEDLEGKKFDFITMWSVLAHLPRPIETLSMLRSFLKPGGAMLVFTVNANSLLMKQKGARWNGYTRNHLAFYSPNTANSLFKKAGFGEVYHRPHYANHLGTLKDKLNEEQWHRFKASVLEHRGGNMNRMLAFNPA